MTPGVDTDLVTVLDGSQGLQWPVGNIRSDKEPIRVSEVRNWSVDIGFTWWPFACSRSKSRRMHCDYSCLFVSQGVQRATY